MYSTCLFCNKSLGANQVIEHLPVGRRLAFDQAKGRLWVVCRRCERWNLTPFEERWEAIEDCERRYRAARKRVSSENIGLAKLDEGLELVRIGKPVRPEFAAWRYSDQFGRRRRRGMMYAAAAGVTAAGAVAAGIPAGVGFLAVPWALLHGHDGIAGFLVRLRPVHIPLRDGSRIVVLMHHLPDIWLSPARGGGCRLHLAHLGGKSILRDDEAMRAASLLMPRWNPAGASKSMVKRAVSALEAAPNPNTFLERVAFLENYRRGMEAREAGAESTRRPPEAAALQGYSAELRLAVEMAVNEENERILMEGDLALLELAWKEAEELAAIADRLLIPSEVERRLQRMRKRGAQGSG